MLTVLGASASPFVRKVRVFLAEKGIPYDQKVVFPASKDAEFRQMSPLGRIPALVDDGITMCDSSVICAYLERKHPTPQLYPADPREYARALWLEEYADTEVAQNVTFNVFGLKIVRPLTTRVPADLEVIERNVKEKVPPILDYLEGEVGDRERLAGDTYSIADIAVATHFVNFRHAGYDVDAARWPKLSRWLDVQLARPIFQQLAAEDRKALRL